MSNFKAGDRVRVVVGPHNYINYYVGREGTLVENTVDYYPWLVMGEAFTDDDGEGLPVREDEIEHVDGE